MYYRWVFGAVASLTLCGLVLAVGELSAGDQAIREAITLLQGRLVQASQPGDQEKITVAIAALEQMVTDLPDADIEAHPQISPQALKEKLAGDAVYNGESGELTIVYTFGSKEQLRDFEAVGDPSIVRGAVQVPAGDSLKHVVRFTTLEVDGTYAFNNLQGEHVLTSGGAGFSFYKNGGVENTELRANSKVVARGNDGAPPVRTPVRFKLRVLPEKVALTLGKTTVGEAVQQAEVGHLLLCGGNGGNSFDKVTIIGKVDAEWARQFFAGP